MNREAVREHLKWRGFGIARDDTLLTLVELNEVIRKGIENPIFKSDIPAMQAILIKKGIRIGDDDPIFSLLAINDAVLRDALRAVLMEQKKALAKARRRSVANACLPGALAIGAGMLVGALYRDPSLLVVGLIGVLIGIGLGFIIAVQLVIFGKFDISEQK